MKTGSYDSKDLARAASGKCPCGRGLSIIGPIEGRASGSFFLKGGRVLTTRNIVNHMAGILNLGQYRLYQEEIDRFRVELVSATTGVGYGDNPDMPDQNLKTAVSKRLRQILGDGEISFEAVRPWEADGTGKSHTVFSRVPIPRAMHE